LAGIGASTPRLQTRRRTISRATLADYSVVTIPSPKQLKIANARIHMVDTLIFNFMALTFME
jgi:hypothetical protein